MLKTLATAMFLSVFAGCSGSRAAAPPIPGNGSDLPVTEPAPPVAGTLLIAGGGSFDDGAVYTTFLHHAPVEGDGVGRIVVLPTASGVPEESGHGLADALRRRATRHAVEVVMLDQDHPELADDPAVAEAIRDADGVWFTGGDQSRITTVFRPAGMAPATGMPDGPSASDVSLRAMLDAGGVVGGTSAGAAMMSDPMIAGGRSEQALLAGVEGGGVLVGVGMGLFPYALTDQHFFERGRMGRLVAALEHTGGRFGIGIEEGRAVLVTLGDAPVLTALGTDAALLVDMADAARDARGNRTGVRLSLLSGGDGWDPLTGAVTPDPGRVPRAVLVPGETAAADDTPADAWDAGAVPDALHALAADPATPQTLRSRAFTLVFSADERTRFAYRADDRRDLCAVDVLLIIRRN